MKKLIPSFVLVTVVVFAVGGCARSTPVSTELPPPTEAPTEPPPTKVPTEPPAPTEPLPPTATPAPTEPPTQEAPPPTEVPAQPPANPSLGDPWARPADEMVMVYIPEGEFEMGSTDAQVDEVHNQFNTYVFVLGWFEVEQPVHTVTLDGFWIDLTEVTNAQYRRCVEAEACEAPGFLSIAFKDPAKKDHPRVEVDWFEAEAYCEWVGARLPTEAEWEYAARGPEGRAFPWGDEFDETRLNYCDASCPAGWADEAVDDGYGDTAPVGSYPDGASWCGALDMAGNAGEWVADWYADDYYASAPSRNPTGPASGEERVMRGGSGYSEPYRGRGAWRTPINPDITFSYGGFRCARDAD